MKKLFALFAMSGIAAGSSAQEPAKSLPMPPEPPPVFNPAGLRDGEKPVEVSSSSETTESNGLYRRVRTVITFTNPNDRDFSGDLEFPVPDGATVCGYALETNGEMVPGVVVGKEKARVAFESEKAKRVDPGIVEHVKGNIWRTRIFPLRPKTPRKAQVEYVEPIAEGGEATVFERDGDDVFVGVRAPLSGGASAGVGAAVASFSKGAILWDASGSAEPFAAAWMKKLESLPEEGDWKLVVFRNDVEVSVFKSRKSLLEAIGALVYDGGTDIGKAVAAASGAPALLFSDEMDTLSLDAPQYERVQGLVVASRGDPAPRAVTVRRLAAGERAPEGVEVKEGTLLATAWAADRVKDLASQADSRKEEFLALGRRYGVASPVTSLIVLESLDQYLEHKIEPPKCMPFHDEWVKRRAAEDDEIAKKEADAVHERDLLALWKERVEWWNNPVPPKKTPKSGLFDGVVDGVSRMFSRSSPAAARRVASSEPMDDGMPNVAGSADLEARSAAVGEMPGGAARSAEAPAPVSEKSAAPAPGTAGSGGATITVAAWNPKSPYMDALSKAGDAYAEYLKQKKDHGSAPAFYMDCAGWFFRKGDAALGWRVMSNMAEFRLDDAAVWRSMGWRLREAGLYDAAVQCFRMALRLRGEEGQSRRDLALVLSEQGKALAAKGGDGAKGLLEEAMALLKEAAFTDFARRSGRRTNDRQVSIVSLEELNALISWIDAVEWPEGAKPAAPALDSAYRRDIPLKIRIALSWDADETDIDLHVLEPDGEEAFYGHRRTGSGGFVSEDVTTGYGPEEYLRKEGRGTFKVLTNYFASHQTALTGPATVTATVYTDWATAAEKREILTLRLDKPKEKHMVGEITVE